MNDSPLKLLTADALIPMTGRGDGILRRAGIVIQQNLIVATGSLDTLRTQFPTLSEEYTPGVMLPGLINAHTHLELGYQRAPAQRPAYFTEWVTTLMRAYPPPEKLTDSVTTAVREGVAASLRGGVTTLGDISRHCRLTRSLLATSPMRVVSFGEVIGLGKMRERRADYLEAAASTEYKTARLTPALSPHAPYTVEGPTLREVCQRAVAGNLRITMHLAELAEEAAFLRDGTGRLADWPLMQNLLDAAVPCCADGPIAWARQWVLLGHDGAAQKVPVLLAHVNYASDADLQLLAASRASVAYCPRTRAFFGHDDVAPHPYRRMLEHGINVCLGTDSLASNPDLSILEEAALLHRRDAFDAYAAMELITTRPATALGLNTGSLASNRLADVVIFHTPPGDTIDATLTALLQNPPPAAAVWIDGERVNLATR